MEGKIFMRADSALYKLQVTPHADFIFDLQRFNKIDFEEGDSVPSNALFSVKKKGETEGTFTTEYYDAATDFITDNLGDAVEYADVSEGYTDLRVNSVAKIAKSTTDTIPTYFDYLSNAMFELDENEILSIINNKTELLKGDKFTYTYSGSSDAAQSAKNFSLSGIVSTSGISITAVDSKPGIFSLGIANFADGGASIVGGGSYTFNLTAGTYDKTFTGSSAADNITNAGSSLIINAGGGSDVITNSGSKVSIDGGEDNDSITNTGDNVSIVGGAGNDTLINTGGSAILDGGAGNDEISGSSLGADTFIFSGGSDTVKGFGANDIVSLGTGFSQITNISDLESVTSDSFKLNFGESSITFSSSTLPVSVKSESEETYTYTKDYVIAGTSQASVTKYSTGFAASISADIVNISASTALANVTGNDNANNIIGSDSEAIAINGGAGADTITAGASGATMDGGVGDDTLKGGGASDTFIFSGGKDVIDSYEFSKDVVQLSGFNPITDGNNLESVDGGFKFNFDSSNSLTFANGSASVSVVGGYIYTATTITKDNKVTLGASFSAATYAGTSDITAIDASAVTVSGFAVTAGNSATNIIGSEKVFTTINGGASSDTLVAGSFGAYMNGGAGADSLVGGDGADKFVFSSGGGNDTIRGYDATGGDSVILSGVSATTDVNKLSNSGGNLKIDFGSDNSLTFINAPEDGISIKSGENTYLYKQTSIALNTEGISLGANYGSTYDGSATSYKTIDGSKVASAIAITGNGDGNIIAGGSFGGALYGGDGDDTLSYASGGASYTLDGGAGADSLVGGDGNDTFIYSGGKDSIKQYNYGTDVVTLSREYDIADSTITTETGGSSSNLVINFGGADNLTFEALGNNPVSLISGSKVYLLSKDSIASANDNRITLNGSYSGPYVASNPYATIDASAVNLAVSITGNSLGNSILATGGGSIDGGKGNDRINVEDRRDGAQFAFVYGEGYGKDYVYGFNQANDTLQVDPTKITSASGGKKFTLKLDKSNKLTLSDNGTDIDKFAFTYGSSMSGSITADGYIVGNTLNLFPSAETVDLTSEIYSGVGISAVSASAVTDQSVKIIADSLGGDFTLCSGGRNRDTFQFGGGNATLRNYQSAYDKIYLGASITSAEISDDNVKLTTDNGTLVVAGAKGNALSIRQTSSSYKKMTFEGTGIYFDKDKKPTSVTISGGASSFSAASNSNYSSIKKITVSGGASNIAVTAGNNVKTTLNAAGAGEGISLIGGKKDDKFTGSDNADTFVYAGGGKDQILNYASGDSISLSGFELSDIKNISATSSKVKLTFKTTNTLTVKGEVSTLNINGENYTFNKDAIIDSDGKVSLTSGASGRKSTTTLGTNIDASFVTKNVRLNGNGDDDVLTGGTATTTLNGGKDGEDTLIGGTGKDIFEYTKGHTGNKTIQDFEFGKDVLDIANTTICDISTVSGGIEFSMASGRRSNDPIATFTLTGIENLDKVAIKAKSSYYWFANEAITETVDGETSTLASAGDLITSSAVKASTVANAGYDVIDLDYSLNLYKKIGDRQVATKLSGYTLTSNGTTKS